MKKTEKLEVRLPPDLKRDFLGRCSSVGRSASETVRAMILSEVRPSGRLTPPPGVRTPFVGVGIITLLFGLLCVILGSYAAWRMNLRLGLSIFLLVQGALYVAAAICVFRLAWQMLAVVLVTQALVQLTYTAEVNPPGAPIEALRGIVIGGLSPTILLAVASLVAWTLTRRHEQRARSTDAR